MHSCFIAICTEVNILSGFSSYKIRRADIWNRYHLHLSYRGIFASMIVILNSTKCSRFCPSIISRAVSKAYCSLFWRRSFYDFFCWVSNLKTPANTFSYKETNQILMSRNPAQSVTIIDPLPLWTFRLISILLYCY